MWPEWDTATAHQNPSDTPPTEGIQRTDLRFYLRAQIPVTISCVLLPSVVVETYGYHYI
jgi:hypothetical protein